MSTNDIVNKYIKASKQKNFGDSAFNNSNKGFTLGGTGRFNNGSPVMDDGLGNPIGKNSWVNSNYGKNDEKTFTYDTTTPQSPQYSSGYENLINQTQNNNGMGNVQVPNYTSGYGVFNPYLNSNLTNLSYYQNWMKQIEGNLNGLLTSKYGAGNFNANGGWYQGNAVEGWDKNAENQGFAQYQKLMTDLQNVNNMIAKYQSIEQSRQHDTSKLASQQDIIEKYLQEDRRIRGVESSGQSETSTNAIINAYINAANQIRQNAQDNLHEQEMAFQNSQYESQMNFDNKMADLKQTQEAEQTANSEARVEELKELISYASTSDDFKLLEERFGDEISENKVLQYLFENAKINIGKVEEEELKEAETTKLNNYLKNYGTSSDQGISANDLAPLMFDWQGIGKKGDQDKLIEFIKQKAVKGEIENGTVIDLNYGANKNGGHYVYYNGSFYPTNRSTTYGWDDVGLKYRMVAEQ